MKLLIFGASGKTGTAVIREALEKGHEVTAFVRNPSRLTVKNKNLAVFTGNVLNPEDVANAVKGHDAVISVLGYSNNAPHTICSDGINNIIAAMKKHKIKRLIAQSSYGNDRDHDTTLYAKFIRIYLKDRQKDKQKMEKIIEQSNLSWTIVKPVIITSKPKSGRYKTGAHIKPPFIPTISQADIADFMLKELEQNKYIHQKPIITS